MRRMSMYYTRTERRDPIFSTQGQEGKDFYILQNRGVVISTRRGRTSIFYMRTGKTSTFYTREGWEGLLYSTQG